MSPGRSLIICLFQWLLGNLIAVAQCILPKPQYLTYFFLYARDQIFRFNTASTAHADKIRLSLWPLRDNRERPNVVVETLTSSVYSYRCLCISESLSMWSLSLLSCLCSSRDDRSRLWCLSRLRVRLWSLLLDALLLLCLFRLPSRHSADLCCSSCRLCSTDVDFSTTCNRRWPSLSSDELFLPRLFSELSLWLHCLSTPCLGDDPSSRTFPDVFTVLDLSSSLGSGRKLLYVDRLPSTAEQLLLSLVSSLLCLRGLRDLLCWYKLPEEPTSLRLSFSCLTRTSFLWPDKCLSACFRLPEIRTSSGNSDFTWTNGKESREAGWSVVDSFTASLLLLRLRDRLLRFFFFFFFSFFFFFFLSNAFTSPAKRCKNYWESHKNWC